MASQGCEPIELHYCAHGTFWNGNQCVDQLSVCKDDEYYDFEAKKCTTIDHGCPAGSIIPEHDRKNLNSTNHCSTLAADKDKNPDCYDCFLGYGNAAGGNKTFCCGGDDFLAGKCTVLTKRSW